MVENNGIPVDAPLWARLVENWGRIKLGLIDAVDADFGVYDQGRFVEARFEAYLARNQIPWPRHPSGGLCLDEDTFRLQARAYPAIAPLRELRYTLGLLRLNDLSIGLDGRNRTILSAFRASYG